MKKYNEVIGIRRMVKFKLLLIVTALALLLFCDGFAPQLGAITEDGIRDAILGKIQVNVATMDANKDGKVDVADLVYLLTKNNTFPTDVYGYVWAGAATFTSDKGSVIPLSYPFAITITKDKVASSPIPGFDPTKGILRQAISGPGEVPGANRPSYQLSTVIPKDLTFSCVESNDIITLSSTEFSIPANDHKNPAGMSLKRTWEIRINKKVLLGGGIDHGTITEKTSGFLPGSMKVISEGIVYLVPFGRVDLAPVK